MTEPRIHRDGEPIADYPPDATMYERFAIDTIDGPGGLRDFQYTEWAVPHYSDHIMAVIWTLRVLGNNTSPEVQAIFDGIAERRKAVAEQQP